MTSVISPRPSEFHAYSQRYINEVVISAVIKLMQALWIVCLLAVATCVAESRRPILRAAPNAVKTGNYVVVLRRNTTTENLQQLLSKASKHSDDAKVHRYVETVAKALTLKLSPYSLEVVSHIMIVYMYMCQYSKTGKPRGHSEHLLMACPSTGIVLNRKVCVQSTTPAPLVRIPQKMASFKTYN